jgi:hypothetical protein
MSHGVETETRVPRVQTLNFELGLRTVNYLSNRECETQASTTDLLFISRVIRRGSRDSSRVRVGLVGARLRRHERVQTHSQLTRNSSQTHVKLKSHSSHTQVT